MAFPTVEEVTEYNGGGWATHTVGVGTPAEDDYLVTVFCFRDTGTTRTNDLPAAGWTVLFDQTITGGSNTSWVTIAHKKAGASEPTSVSYTLGSGRSASAATFRISGWGGTLSTDVDYTTSEFVGSATPNPPSVTAGWGSDDNLYLALVALADDGVLATGYPTDYTGNNGYATSGASDNANSTVAYASRELAASSDDPGTFTFDSSDVGCAVTLVVKPEASAAVVPQIMHHRQQMV